MKKANHKKKKINTSFLDSRTKRTFTTSGTFNPVEVSMDLHFIKDDFGRLFSDEDNQDPKLFDDAFDALWEKSGYNP